MARQGTVDRQQGVPSWHSRGAEETLGLTTTTNSCGSDCHLYQSGNIQLMVPMHVCVSTPSLPPPVWKYRAPMEQHQKPDTPILQYMEALGFLTQGDSI